MSKFKTINPDVHIICGKCGCNNMFYYKISDDVDEKEKLEQVKALREALSGPLLERAIGVIYKPRTERQSHYFYAELPEQFDLVIHVDRTAAVRPLEPAHHSWEEEHLAKEDMPESYPFGV